MYILFLPSSKENEQINNSAPSHLLNLSLDFLSRNIILNRAQHIDSLNILIPLTYKYGDFGKNKN